MMNLLMKLRKSVGASSHSFSVPETEPLRILIPVSDCKKASLDGDIAIKNLDQPIEEIRFLHCIEDRLTSGNFMLALEILQIADEQDQKRHELMQELNLAAKVLSKAYADTPFSVAIELSTSTANTIAEEAVRMNANLILFVDAYDCKRRWSGTSEQVRKAASCHVQVINQVESNKPVKSCLMLPANRQFNSSHSKAF